MSNSNSPGWKRGSLRFAVVTAVVFLVATMITFPFSGFSTAVAQQQLT
jgi:hypothetical protein